MGTSQKKKGLYKLERLAKTYSDVGRHMETLTERLSLATGADNASLGFIFDEGLFSNPRVVESVNLAGTLRNGTVS
ncbi:unnamed protein product [Toxocara canis]|uniref:Transposase n=1 Tax=Toxocara canis TaxID=6265 RepID=A0A183UN24_TOXCA|nr:unnamed protein product [Toxocara canis]